MKEIYEIIVWQNMLLCTVVVEIRSDQAAACVRREVVLVENCLCVCLSPASVLMVLLGRVQDSGVYAVSMNV